FLGIHKPKLVFVFYLPTKLLLFPTPEKAEESTSLALLTGSRCTTYWFDRDDPSGKGDYEILSELRKEYPGEICAQPIGIEAETLEGQPASTTGQIFKLSSPSEGFACVNQDQKGGFCQDYKVRFICPPDFCSACKTQWFDRDDPSGHGDFETLAELRREYPDQICPRPIQIEARTLSGVLASETGQNISKFDTTVGFVCVHAHQKPLQFCHDYKVQFTCPESFCSSECKHLACERKMDAHLKG
uniref:WxxW domain-containing protein n=1 Tax=Salvator merianae TaxID=96440 RepID=A0A8D0BUA6_SALMN